MFNTIYIKKNCIVAEWLVNVFRLLFLSIAILDNFIQTNNLYTTSSSHQQEKMLSIIYIKTNCIVAQWLLNVLLLLLSYLFITEETNDNLQHCIDTSSSHQQEKNVACNILKQNYIAVD